MGIYLETETVAEKGNPSEARTPWSHQDDSCSTRLPAGKGTRQILTVLRSFKHSPAPCFTTRNYNTPSPLNTPRKAKQSDSVQVSGSAPRIRRVPTQSAGRIPCLLLQRRLVLAVPPLPNTHQRVLAKAHLFSSRETHQQFSAVPKTLTGSAVKISLLRFQ